ncbi:hypothetical protein ACKWTF_000935 [Chironomus riparius]
MGNKDDPLNGFSWVSGTKRDTTGIIIWSDIFLHTIDTTGEKIAIFVIDTQGLFDTESTPTDNSRIFALGTLISSIQVLNLKNRIQEDQLQYLQFATNYAKFNVAEAGETNENPFQNLTFLIRDWENDKDFAFGIDGGKQYFEEEVLKIKPSQKEELISVRESIRSSFETIECCLLPHPGKHVSRIKEYDGRWSSMDEEFKEELEKIIELLLLPKNMVLKKVNGQELTGMELKDYIMQFFKIFQSDDIPETLTIYELTVESNMNSLIKKCIDDYKKTMYRNRELISNEESIQIMHKNCKDRALELFNKERKMGSIDHEEKFKAKLNSEIDSIFNFFASQNFLSQAVEEEVARQKALLDRETQQRLELEQVQREAERRLVELVENGDIIEDEEHVRQREILEARINAENNRLQAIERQANENHAFTEMLTVAMSAFTLGAPFFPGGVVARLAVTAAGAVILRGISTVANRCTIM